MNRGEHNGRYILDSGGEPVPEPDLMAWAQWIETSHRRIVQQTRVRGAKVSTVFLGLDHSFAPGGPPLLFETMVFGGPLDEEQRRYNTRSAAIDGHEEMCRKVREKSLNLWLWARYFWRAWERRRIFAKVSRKHGALR